MTAKTLIPFEATHPGTLIKDELEVRDDLTQKDLAILLGVKPSFLNEIVKGKRSITADIAILLEKSLGIPADYWMKFQSQYEIDSAKIKEKNIVCKTEPGMEERIYATDIIRNGYRKQTKRRPKTRTRRRSKARA